MIEHVVNLVNMRSTSRASGEPGPSRTPSDLTTRARIRDAAIAVFGAQGFDASVRTIATEAAVSPGLVIHHFGSKDKLRAVCDEHVTALIGQAKQESVGPRAASTLLSQLAVMDEYAWLLGYVMQSFSRGGPLAGHLFEMMAADAEGYIAEGVRQGTIRESVDPPARARFLANTAIGSMMLMMSLEQPGPGADWAQLMQRWSQEFMLPALELYTHGLFTDDSVLQTYLDHVAGTPATDPGPDPAATDPPASDQTQPNDRAATDPDPADPVATDPASTDPNPADRDKEPR